MRKLSNSPKLHVLFPDVMIMQEAAFTLEICRYE